MMCLIINEYQQKDLEKDHIDVYYQKKTTEIQEILNLLHKQTHRLFGKHKGREYVFPLDEVYYFESVDKKTFAYLQKKVLQLDTRLQDIEEAYRSYGFIRINKATIINVYKIASLEPSINMRLLAVLENGEKMQINRSYKQGFHAYLQTLQRRGKENENHK